MIRLLQVLASCVVVWVTLSVLSEIACGQQAHRAGGRVGARLPEVLQHRHSRHASVSRRSGGSAQRASGETADSYEETLAPGATQSTPELLPKQASRQSGENDLGCDHCGMSNGCCCYAPGYLLDWRRADLWVGVSSFTGPGNFLTTGASSDGQVEGSFGFQEGFNFGARLPSLLRGQMGSQIGMRFTHTQIDGTAAGTDSRTQAFMTAGLFRRVDYGFQGGLVVDYLHDDWVYQADLVQLRGELSFLFSACHDFGFRFTDSQQTDDVSAVLRGSATPVARRLAALNTYRFFYRYRFSDLGRGLAELSAGFTEDSGGVLGLDLKTPLQGQLGLETKATYVIPSRGAAVPYAEEGWNLGVAIVWTPGRIFGTQRDYYRPLLDVADNGSLLSKLVP